ncbi:hypothetical protein ACUXAV_000221 [Cupriavidus metallidurans]|jgi:hypothetical protein
MDLLVPIGIMLWTLGVVAAFAFASSRGWV